ncbi:MAG: hypothetical protein KAZ87_10455 [Spirochaetes bacterium]|nr:hypothetical protein [Spirochaetota bacterium]
MKYITVFILFIPFLIPGSTHSGINEDSGFFRSARIAADAEYFLPNTNNYSGSLTNYIEFNIYQRNRFNLSFSMKERTVYGGNGFPENSPSAIQYLPIEFVHASFDTGHGYLGFLIDHECFNYCGRFIATEDRYRWYGAALKWRSYGMNISEGIYPDSESVSFIPRLNYSVYAGKSIATVEYPYKFLFQTDVRLELMNLYGFFPYIRAYGYFIVDDTLRASRVFEAGLICPAGKIYLSPYARYSYAEDFSYYKCPPVKYFSAGLNVETRFLMNNIDNSAFIENGHDKSFISPSMHFSCGYGREFRSSRYGNTAEGNIILDFFSTREITVYCENSLIHKSPSQITMMYPWRLEYTARGGILFGSALSSAVFSAEYAYSRNSYGNDDETIPEKHHSVFISAGSPGMYTHTEYDYREYTDRNDNFPMNIQWKIEAGKYFKKEHYPYDYLIRTSLERDFIISNKSAVYILPSIGITGRTSNKLSYSAEFGLKHNSGLLLNPFIKFTDDALSVEGHAEKEKLIFAGFRILK